MSERSARGTVNLLRLRYPYGMGQQPTPKTRFPPQSNLPCRISRQHIKGRAYRTLGRHNGQSQTPGQKLLFSDIRRQISSGDSCTDFWTVCGLRRSTTLEIRLPGDSSPGGLPPRTTHPGDSLPRHLFSSRQIDTLWNPVDYSRLLLCGSTRSPNLVRALSSSCVNKAFSERGLISTPLVNLWHFFLDLHVTVFATFLVHFLRFSACSPVFIYIGRPLTNFDDILFHVTVVHDTSSDNVYCRLSDRSRR